jgi:aspartate--ammonia ligase
VDQWDWERVISPEERNLDFLKGIVRRIYDVIKRTEKYVCYHYSVMQPTLPKEIAFVHSEELEERYPELTPNEREKTICEEHRAVFIIGIGGNLKNGTLHDGRAPDYDDWSTPTGGGYKGLNGELPLSIGGRNRPVAAVYVLPPKGSYWRDPVKYLA